MHQSIKLSLIVAAALVVGAVIGSVGTSYRTSYQMPREYYTREGGYEFINPLIACNLLGDSPYAGFLDLKESLRSAITSHVHAGDATRVSVYFRDMDRGYWTGVNEKDQYLPGSLAKVPYMIALLREVRDKPDLLSTSIKVSAADDSPLKEFYPPSQRIVNGATYTLDELLRAMIVRSDNDALLALAGSVTNDTLADVYSNFGVPPMDDPDAKSVSPDSFSRFFRIIYNASYLGRVRSQSALKLMSETEFHDGLQKGVPAGTTVSHKFGEREAGDGTLSLHDCGIVYYPHSPYELCVMTEGSSYPALSGVIGDLSRIAYTAVQGGLLSHEPRLDE